MNNLNHDSLPFYDVKAGIMLETGTIEIDLKMTIPYHEIHDKTISFLLSSAAKISSIGGSQLKEYHINEAGPGINIYTFQFDSDIESVTSIELSYTLTIPDDHQVNRISNEWIELNVDSFWHPVMTTFPRFHYSLELYLDHSFQILTGDKISSSEDTPNLRSIHSGFPRFDISFASAQNFHSIEGKYARVYSINEDPGTLDSLLLLADQALEFLLEYTGMIKDFESKRIVVVSPRKEVGYARENYVVLSKIEGMDIINLSIFLAHEFSHYWFSNTNPNTPDYWLDEAFAEFCAMIFTRQTFGQQAYDDNLKNKKQHVKADPNTLASYENRPSHVALYYTGPIILHHFENYLGRDNFQLLIREMIAHIISTTDSLMVLIRNQFNSKASEKLNELRNTHFHE
ncbi:MAG TPA: M1 family aminopeptidase [Saprospiraceae bacterium]|nr:M1 family aminopeptidase [Saprospiraceae bacterium]